MSDWGQTSLGEVITHQKGFAFKSKDYQKAGVPVVRVSNFMSDSIDISELYFVSSNVAEENKNVELQTDDIVIATVGSWPSNPASIVGKTIRVPEEANGALLNQNAVRLRVKDLNPDDQNFLYYVLKRPDFINYLVSTAQGSANQASITLKDIFNYQFEWPGKEERKVIGEFFNSIDKKIELNRQINQTLEQIAQAIFKSWFVDFEPVKAKIQAKQNGQDPERAAMRAISGKTDEQLDQLNSEQRQQLTITAALFPDELVDSELGEIPKGWEMESLSKFFDVKHGFAFKGEFFKDEPTNYILLTPGNFKIGGGFKFDKLKFYEGPIPEDYVLTKGDLLLTMTDLSKQADTLGYPAIVPNLEDKKFLHNQRLGKVVYKEDFEFGSYFYYLFKIHRYRNEIVGGASGSTVKHTAPKKILAVKVPFSNCLEREFNKAICSFNEKANQLFEEIVCLEKMRDNLLPKLLSGEIEIEAA
jgi:type I restriction enzyme, S subunit